MSYDFLPQAVVDAGTHLGRVITLMTEGVAFRQDGQIFNVFSHEGDELGQVTTADVSFAIMFMKKRGRVVGKCTHPTYGENKNFAIEPAFSFAWQNWLVINGQRM